MARTTQREQVIQILAPQRLIRPMMQLISVVAAHNTALRQLARSIPSAHRLPMARPQVLNIRTVPEGSQLRIGADLHSPPIQWVRGKRLAAYYPLRRGSRSLSVGTEVSVWQRRGDSDVGQLPASNRVPAFAGLVSTSHRLAPVRTLRHAGVQRAAVVPSGVLPRLPQGFRLRSRRARRCPRKCYYGCRSPRRLDRSGFRLRQRSCGAGPLSF